MSIQQNELKLYKAAQNSNVAAANGGVASYDEIISGVNNNLLPDVSQAERIAGITHFRKVFYRNLNEANLSLLNARVFMENYTPADDAVYLHAGSFAELQSQLTGTEPLYGCAKLDANVAAGASHVDVLLEQASVQFFHSADTVRISNKASIDASGAEEFVALDPDTPPVIAGSVVTLTFLTPLANSYLASNTRVANCLQHGTMEAFVSETSVTSSGSGAYDDVESPLTGDNLGTVYDAWTITFTDGSAFICVGARTGSVGAGVTGVDYTPINHTTTRPFFVMLAGGFSGAWQAGDTITFDTEPASIPFWVKRIVPPNCAAYAGDKAVISLDGETA
jgi:hypothetical protein